MQGGHSYPTELNLEHCKKTRENGRSATTATRTRVPSSDGLFREFLREVKELVDNLGLPHFRLFILGAGFSKPAGLPLAGELLQLVRDEVQNYFGRNGGRDGPLERDIEQWTKLYPGQQIDLERVLAFSHRRHFLRLLGSDEYYAHGSRSIVAARRAIQRVLIDATPVDTPSLHREFAKHLSPNDVVLTFNYDTLLEQSLDSIGKSYTLTPEWWLARSTPESVPEHVDLLKLHGSIDWYDRKYHDDTVRLYREEGYSVPDRDPIFGPDSLVPTEALSKCETKAFGHNLLERVFRVPNHSRYFPLGDHAYSSVVPFLLPLAHDKLLGYDAILDLWENLHRTLDSFSSVVVIGYSMPPYDSYAFEALCQLFVDYQEGGDKTSWGQRRVPIQLVTLANSKKDSLKNMPFFDSTKTRVWDKGFSDDALAWLDWGDGDVFS